jgi:hypothetical protein
MLQVVAPVVAQLAEVPAAASLLVTRRGSVGLITQTLGAQAAEWPVAARSPVAR